MEFTHAAHNIKMNIGRHDTSPDTLQPELQDEIDIDQLYDCVHGQQTVKLKKKTFICFKRLS
jgi:hypothetical protein